MKNLIYCATVAFFTLCFWSCTEQSKDFTGDFGSEQTQYRQTDQKNLSPYAMFGDSSFVLMTDAEREARHFLSVITDNSDKYSRLDIELKTGRIVTYNKSGKMMNEFILPSEVFARFLQVDPRAEKYQGWSPYNYVMGNPIRNVDPNGDTVRVVGENGSFDWTPGATYNIAEDAANYDSFIAQTVSALNYLTSPSALRQGVGILTFQNEEEEDVRGHVLIDFATGKYSDETITVVHDKDGSNMYGAGTITFDPTAGLHLNKTPKQKEGFISPAILLLHEFGHAWLDHVNPKLKQKMKENYMIGPESGKPYTKYGDNVEHDYILSRLENPASKALNQGVRKHYRNIFWEDDAPGPDQFGIINYDDIYRTISPITTKRKKKKEK